jgi:hypothetical protein
MRFLEEPLTSQWLIWTFALGVGLTFMFTRWWRKGKARRRANRGFDAEDRAVEFLKQRGFSVLENPCGLQATMWVDGEEQTAPVRADFLVERGGQKFIVEVKSTPRAGNPMFPETRRQLREYASATGHSLLLLDMSAGSLMEVKFDAPPGKESSWLEKRKMIGMMGAAIFGFLLGWLCALTIDFA